jgi:hypothetical protein
MRQRQEVQEMLDQIQDPDRIWPGQVFTMPNATPEGDPIDWDALGDRVTEGEEPNQDVQAQ